MSAGERYSLFMQTTDNQDEIFDIVDQRDRVIGKATRGEVHKDPSLIHRSIAILVYRNDELFLQKRSMTKDAFPGVWTCSVAGHVDSGESYEEAAIREMQEELGIKALRPPSVIRERVMPYDTETERTRFFRYDDATSTPIVLDARESSEGHFFPVTKELLEKIGTDMPATPCLKFLAETYLLERLS